MQRGSSIGVLTPSGWFRASQVNSWHEAEELARNMKARDIRSQDDVPAQELESKQHSWKYIGIRGVEYTHAFVDECKE
jgi:hypothetical protein